MRLQVTDSQGVAMRSDILTISAGVANLPPVVIILSPAPAATWDVGSVVTFSATATDPEDGAVPTWAMWWSLILQHCPSACHAHPVREFPGVANGSFVAPDHEYPSCLELVFYAWDAQGQVSESRVRLDPRTVTLAFASTPAGMQLAIGSAPGVTPFTRTVIAGSTNSISAPAIQSKAGVTYAFAGWSDGGAATHTIVASTTASTPTYTATYTAPLHVGDLDGARRRVNARAWNVTATVAVVDAANSPVAGVRVAGSWLGRSPVVERVSLAQMDAVV